jgi:hypothetical protein
MVCLFPLIYILDGLRCNALQILKTVIRCVRYLAEIGACRDRELLMHMTLRVKPECHGHIRPCLDLVKYGLIHAAEYRRVYHDRRTCLGILYLLVCLTEEHAARAQLLPRRYVLALAALISFKPVFR